MCLMRKFSVATAWCVKWQTFHASRGPIVDIECDQCNGKYKTAGPIWSALLHYLDVVRKIRDHLENSVFNFPPTARLYRLRTSISEELVNVPLHYTLPGLSKVLTVSILACLKFKMPPATLVCRSILSGNSVVPQRNKSVIDTITLFLE